MPLLITVSIRVQSDATRVGKREKSGVGKSAALIQRDCAALPLEQALRKVEGRPGGANDQGAARELNLAPARAGIRPGQSDSITDLSSPVAGWRRGDFEVAAGPVAVGALDQQVPLATSMVPPWLTNGDADRERAGAAVGERSGVGERAVTGPERRAGTGLEVVGRSALIVDRRAGKGEIAGAGLVDGGEFDSVPPPEIVSPPEPGAIVKVPVLVRACPPTRLMPPAVHELAGPAIDIGAPTLKVPLARVRLPETESELLTVSVPPQELSIWSAPIVKLVSTVAVVRPCWNSTVSVVPGSWPIDQFPTLLQFALTAPVQTSVASRVRSSSRSKAGLCRTIFERAERRRSVQTRRQGWVRRPGRDDDIVQTPQENGCISLVAYARRPVLTGTSDRPPHASDGMRGNVSSNNKLPGNRSTFRERLPKCSKSIGFAWASQPLLPGLVAPCLAEQGELGSRLGTARNRARGRRPGESGCSASKDT